MSVEWLVISSVTDGSWCATLWLSCPTHEAQHNYLRLVRANLLLLIIGAALSAIALFSLQEKQLLSVLLTVTFSFSVTVSILIYILKLERIAYGIGVGQLLSL